MESGNAAAQREAVRSAEQTVADAWIGQLLLAEAEAEAVVSVCDRKRQLAVEQIRIARRAGDISALAQAQSAFHRAAADCDESLQDFHHAGTRLAEHLTDWACFTQRRISQRQADCDDDAGLR
jgi:hypothetical protein